MVNHGLVVAALLFIVALLAARAGGSEDIRDMGGIAFRAPVLASIFLIVSLATLAMPGSSNFVGEFLILLGVFKSKLAIAMIAFTGVVMASVYALRLFIRAMHNRVGPDVDSREISAARRRCAGAAGRGDPVHGALPAAGAAPQRTLGQGAPSRRQRGCRSAPNLPTAALRMRRRASRDRRTRRRRGEPWRERDEPAAPRDTHLHGPHVDFAALSPLIALLGGAVVVLLVGLLGSRKVARAGRPAAHAGRARRRGRA